MPTWTSNIVDRDRTHSRLNNAANYTPMNACLVHERQEVACDLLDASARIFENGHYDFSLRNPRLIERYLQHKLSVLVHLRFRGIEGEFVACFQREPIHQGVGGDREGVGESQHVVSDLSRESWIDLRDARRSSHQQAMLVDNVQAMESPKGVIPSLVWLQALDSLYSVLPHALYLSRERGLLLLGERFTIADWEADMLGRLGLSRHPDEPASEVVKCASEVLNRISGNEADLWRNGRDGLYDKGALSSIRVILYNDTIRVGLHEQSGSIDEITDVLIGPLDL
jgi:hypothetical protein